MARATRDAKLETRSARDRLAPGKYHWRGIGKGLAIGYRKGKGGGSWTVRLLVDNKYITAAIGQADDHQDANALDVLDYFQAQAKARQLADDRSKRKAGTIRPYTVADAIRDYLEWYAVHRKALRDAQLTCNAHILPALGRYAVNDLTSELIRKWHEALAKAPARVRTRKGEKQATRETADKRSRLATANRILTVLKAALNHAWRDGKVASDDAWRRVKPFRNVAAPRVRFLSQDEIRRLLNACDADAHTLAMGALQTGCRYGELVAMCAEDVNPVADSVFIRDPKNGKPRHVPLTEEGQRFFAKLVVGKAGKEHLFLKNGRPWGRAEQDRAIKRAAKAAGIEGVSFHILRHTYGSSLAMRGVPLQVIAEALGHADTRITSRHYAHLLPSYVADTIRAHLPAFGVEADNVVSINR